MTDESLIEEARAFAAQSYVGRVTARELDRAILLIRRMVDTFGEAHAKPLSTSPERVKIGADSSHVAATDGEREPSDLERAVHLLRGYGHDKAADWLIRRSEVPEPSGPAYIDIMPPSPETAKRWWTMYCRECGIEEGMADSADNSRLIAQRDEHNRTMHAPEPSVEAEKWRKRCAEETIAWTEATKRADVAEARWRAAEDECRAVQARLDALLAEPQGNPPAVQLMARKGGKTQALIDRMLAQANERGIRVEVVHPQGEPTEAEVRAGAYVLDEGAMDAPEDYPLQYEAAMSTARDVLRAARATEQEGTGR